MIKSFADGDTELLWDTGKRRRVPASIRSAAMKTLRILHRAIQLADLRVPPGNRLNALTGNRKGQFSIRINDQFRVCFVWSEGNAYDVEIVDYH